MCYNIRASHRKGEELSMIDTIIFDIGNVLLDFDYMRVFRSR